MVNEKKAWAKIIEMYEDMPYMWDKNHKQYFNREYRQEGFKKLLQIYQECDEDLSLAQFKKKVENMRTTYSRELKKVKASKYTASGTGDVYVPSLWYFDLFHFLEDINEPCRTGADSMDGMNEKFEISLDGQLYEYPESLTANYSTSIQQSSREQVNNDETVKQTLLPKKQRLSFFKYPEKVIDLAQKLITVKEEEWEIIGKSVGIQIKDLNKFQSTVAQKIISDVIFYAKLGKLTEESFVALKTSNTVSQIPSQYVDQSPSSRPEKTLTQCSNQTNTPQDQTHTYT